MNKQLIATAAAFSLFFGGAVLPLSTAHAAPATQPSGQKSGGLEKLKSALQQLDLTDAQKEKIKVILADAKSKAAAASAPAAGGALDKTPMKSIVKATSEKIGAVLTTEQKTKLKELMKPTKSA